MKQFDGYERISLIISKAKKGPFDWTTISRKIENLYLSKGKTQKASIRTFQRDREQIASIHGILIAFNRRTKQYEVDRNATSLPQKMALLESFDIIRAFQMNQNINENVIFDNRNTRGTEHLFGLVHAIQNCHPVSFEYQKFNKTDGSLERTKPIGLKEFKKRWYLIGQTIDDKLRIYGMDRMDNLMIMDGKFRLTEPIDLKKSYEGVFGISNEDKPIEHVELHFAPLKGKYIKSLPLHESQVILSDDEDGLKISLKVKVNYDLVLEIMSHSDEVRIISPDHLLAKILERASNICAGILREEGKG